MNNTREKKIKIGITIGDVNGIGPEVLIKAFMDQRLLDVCIPIIYGSGRAINIYRKILGIERFNYHLIQQATHARNNKINLIDCVRDLERVDIGQPSEVGGKAAQVAIKNAIEDAKHQQIDAMVTLPVDKSSFQKQDESFTGHTELLAEAFSVDINLMMMVSETLKVGLVTNHLPIRDVPRNLSIPRIVSKISLMDKSLKEDFSLQKPLIAVLGLNPHAGDSGLIGDEEQALISKAIEETQEKGMLVQGPYSADGFFGSLAYRKFDGVIAMYHDQGLIPFKLIAGYSGVNFTAGMPFIRTSPDHGVAFDIAGKDLADPESFRQSLYLAVDIYRNRTENQALIENALKPQPKGAHKNRLEKSTEAKPDLLLGE